MAEVRPFRALRYTEPLEPLLAPPYDVLDDAQVTELRARSPHNVVHLTRPGSDYAGARALLEGWRVDGVLREDPVPAMFVHETDLDGTRRLDLLAVLRLQPYAEGAVLPHERTHAGPKADRLALLRATGMSLEPVWFLAPGLRQLLERAPTGDRERFAFEGRRHTLGRVTDPDWLRRVGALVARRPALIADGHHRYETALAYAREVEAGPSASSGYTLALVTDLEDGGLEVLPTHRLLKAGVAVTGGEPMAGLAETLAAIRARPAAGTYRDGSFQVLPLEGGAPVVELHRQVIDNILGRRSAEEMLAYTRDAEQAVRWVDEGRGVAAFFLDKPDLRVVLRLAQEGRTLPEKATYFFPKPPSGMAFHRLDPGHLL